MLGAVLPLCWPHRTDGRGNASLLPRGAKGLTREPRGSQGRGGAGLRLLHRWVRRRARASSPPPPCPGPPLDLMRNTGRWRRSRWLSPSSPSPHTDRRDWGEAPRPQPQSALPHCRVGAGDSGSWALPGSPGHNSWRAGGGSPPALRLVRLSTACGQALTEKTRAWEPASQQGPPPPRGPDVLGSGPLVPTWQGSNSTS